MQAAAVAAADSIPTARFPALAAQAAVQAAVRDRAAMAARVRRTQAAEAAEAAANPAQRIRAAQADQADAP
jgi:hypothetical protein